MGNSKNEIFIPDAQIMNASTNQNNNQSTVFKNTNINQKNYENKNNCQSSFLFFENYGDYLKGVLVLKHLIKSVISNYVILNAKQNSKILKIKNSYFNYLEKSDINMEVLFNTTMSVYHRIGTLYGVNQNYPKEELSKITFPLIAKYLAYNSFNRETSIKNKIIKRINFFCEEFPYKLYKIMNLIQTKCCYVYGYDIELNLNIYIEPKNLGNYIKYISFMDYIIYISFIVEIILPALKDNGKYFNNKINILINFNGEEANSEMITFIMTYMDNLFPLTLNKMHIINYSIKKLKQDITFQESLEKINYFQMIFFHHNNSYIDILKKVIDINMMPVSFKGKANVPIFDFKNNMKNPNAFVKYLIKCIFGLERDISKANNNIKFTNENNKIVIKRKNSENNFNQKNVRYDNEVNYIFDIKRTKSYGNGKIRRKLFE